LPFYMPLRLVSLFHLVSCPSTKVVINKLRRRITADGSSCAALSQRLCR
jgi:hypothetical protein